MELNLRAYIDILKPHKRMIAEAATILAVVGPLLTALKTPVYLA